MPRGPSISDEEILDAAWSLRVPPGDPLTCVRVAEAVCCSLATVQARRPRLVAEGLWPWADGRSAGVSADARLDRAIRLRLRKGDRSKSGRSVKELARDMGRTERSIRNHPEVRRQS